MKAPLEITNAKMEGVTLASMLHPIYGLSAD
jgi:hypothetical protein